MKYSFSVQPIQGYFLMPRQFSAAGHTLCGDQSLRGAVSPNSTKPLLQLLQLSTDDSRLELSGIASPTLHLLYSWTCPISEGVFSYRLAADEVELINFTAGSPYPGFPYENYPESFPAIPVDLLPLKPLEQDAIDRLNSIKEFSDRQLYVNLDRLRHQVGGRPRLMQPPFSGMRCPCCKAQMPLFASIANENGVPHGFADNDFVQVVYHLCRTCTILSCYHMVD